MSERNFMQLLKGRWDEGKFVCVGLDSDAGKVKELNAKVKFANVGEDDLYNLIISFNQRIVDATKDLVCAYKPNSAFYEALGADGILALGNTIAYIRSEAPDVPVILDYKRADIGNTNNGYVAAAEMADAVTVNPYFGSEALKPFLDQKNKGIIILCRTSNPGAGEFQDLMCDFKGECGLVVEDVQIAERGIGVIHSIPLYQVVAHQVAKTWNYNANCALVVGATYPDELTEVRKIIGDMPILIPGVGKQGGDLEAAVKAGRTEDGRGMIINNSSAIIFSEDPRTATEKMHNDVTAALAA